MPEPPLSGDLKALEARLRGLTPAAAPDRDRLMFEAGRASARRGWAWPLAAVTASLTAAVLAVVLLTRPGPTPTERIVYLPAPAERPEAPPSAPVEPPVRSAEPPSAPQTLSRYQRLQDQLLRWDLDGLPSATAAPAPPAPSRDDLLRSL
jgi:hypothetical protein